MKPSVLIIDSSILGQQSQSKKLTQAYRSELQAKYAAAKIVTRDLAAEPLGHLTGKEMAAWATPAKQRSTAQQQIAQLSEAVIQQVRAADRIVIGVPMYNLSIPSQLKTWIDRLARAGETFKYTSEGPQGLLEGKQVVILATRGGRYAGTEADTQTPYFKAVFGLMGISDVRFVYAEGLSMGEEVQAEALDKAMSEISQLV